MWNGTLSPICVNFKEAKVHLFQRDGREMWESIGHGAFEKRVRYGNSKVDILFYSWLKAVTYQYLLFIISSSNMDSEYHLNCPESSVISTILESIK